MKEYHPNCRKRVYYHANKERLNAERIRKKQDAEAARRPSVSQKIRLKDGVCGLALTTWWPLICRPNIPRVTFIIEVGI